MSGGDWFTEQADWSIGAEEDEARVAAFIDEVQEDLSEIVEFFIAPAWPAGKFDWS